MCIDRRHILSIHLPHSEMASAVTVKRCNDVCFVQLRSVESSEKLRFHDNDDNDLVVYCSQIFSSEERLVTVGPSTDSTKPGQSVLLSMELTPFWHLCLFFVTYIPSSS